MTHTHAWKYRHKPSKAGVSTLVERRCACGFAQWYAIGEKEWSKGVSTQNGEKRGSISPVEPSKKVETTSVS